MTAPGPAIEDLQYLEHLGSGGYSEVYLYERRSPRMRVAVKVLKDVQLSEAELRQFAAEAETMAELADHPYIVQVFSMGTLADGRPYLVMKYYPPPNLGARAARERFSVPDVLRTGVKIASAVETAHRAGILHRDIKPANILVSQYGEPGLTDFGIAGHASETDTDDDLGVSIPWSPPEVLTGTSNGSVQSDVYSLGATLWHLLAGRSPFEVPGGDNGQRALMGRVLRTPPPQTGRGEVPASLERLLSQAMAKNAAVRPRSALEFARGLQGVEQELRLARTEIVVEELEAHRTHAGPSGTTPLGDPTRLRAHRITAQPAAPASAFAPRASPKPDSPATRARPIVAIDSVPATQAGNDQPRARAVNPEARAGATVRRPGTALTAPDELDVALPRRSGGLGRPYVAVIAAGVVAAAVIVGVVLTSNDGSPHATPSGAPPTVLDTADLNQPAVQSDPPTVSARYDARRRSVSFSWRAAAATRPSGFAWFPAGQPSTLTRTGRPGVVLPRRTARVCIQVLQIASDGSQSAPSKPACG